VKTYLVEGRLKHPSCYHTDPRWNEGKAFYARADEIGFIEALYELTEREELFRNLEI
jgi:hypothetical protein